MRALVIALAACGTPKPATTPAAPAPAPAPAAHVAAPAPAPAPNAAPDPALVDQGKQLMDKFGCIACHTSDGTPRVGPTFKGYFGMALVEADGTAVVGSEDRLRRSLEHAAALKDFPASMPTYKGLVSDDDAKALVAYVKSL
jgi:cytochrome c oxidase subunit 2